MASSEHVTAPRAPRPWGTYWAKPVGWILSRTLWRVEVHGAHNVPKFGRTIMAANHAGLVDGPLVFGCVPRRAHFLVKGAFFKGALGMLMQAAGQIPVRRGEGRTTLEIARAILERNDAVGIFPEGTRGRGDAARLHHGVGWLAVHTDTPVIPIAVLGTRGTGKSVSALPRFRGRIVLVCGEPVAPVRGVDDAESVRLTTTAVGTALQTLIAQSEVTYGVRLPEDDPRAGAK